MPGSGPHKIPVVFYRTSLPSNRIARVVFSVRQGRILVLHGFIKKTQRTSPDDLALARRRNREFGK